MKAGFKLSGTVSKLCVALLTFLGYSCDSMSGGDMYGTPTGTWEIKGEVRDETNEAVQTARIKITYPDVNSSEYQIGETKSNEKGDYIISGRGFRSSLKVVCVPEDPILEPDSTVVDMFKLEVSKNGWYNAPVNPIVNFKLKRKGSDK